MTLQQPARRMAVDVQGGARARLARERRADPSLATYLASIGGYPLLTRADEMRYGECLRRGRPASGIGPLTRAAHLARQRLAEGNLRLVALVAACYAGQGVPLLDIIMAGNEGLMRAIDKYDATRSKFASHATWWIREACGRYVLSQCSDTHVARHTLEARRLLHRLDAGDVTAAEGVASLSPAHVARARATQERAISLDREIQRTQTARDGEPVTLLDVLPMPDDAPTVEALGVQAATNSDLYRKMATALTDRERLVLALYYGLGNTAHALSYEAIGRQMGRSREHVRQIVLAAVEKLRAAYDAEAHPEKPRQADLWASVS